MRLFHLTVLSLSIGCNPAELAIALDLDGDGLLEDEENELGTDPNKADTDDDGYDDDVEIAENTDPLDEFDHPYQGGWGKDSCRNDIVSTGNDIGQIAENFKLPNQHDEAVQLHDFCGRTVFMVTSAFW